MLLADNFNFSSDFNNVLPDLEQEEVFRILTAFQRYEYRALGLQNPSSAARKEAPIAVDTPPAGVQKTAQFSCRPLNKNTRSQDTSHTSKDPSMPSLSIDWSDFTSSAKRKVAPRAVNTPPTEVHETVQFSFLNQNTRPQAPSMPLLDFPMEEKPSIIIDWCEFLSSSAAKRETPIAVDTPPAGVQKTIQVRILPRNENTEPQVISHTSLDCSMEEEPALIIDWHELPVTPPKSPASLSEEEFDMFGLSASYQPEKKFYPDPVLIPGKSLPALHRYPQLADPKEQTLDEATPYHPAPAELTPDDPILDEPTPHEPTPHGPTRDAPTPEVSHPAKRKRSGEQLTVGEILATEVPKPLPHRVEKRGRKKLARPPTIPGKYYCAPCDKNFLLARSLLQHQNAHHSGPRPFRCDECGKRFPDEAHLTEHAKVHAVQEKLFQCPECGRRYLSRQSCQRHYMVNHGEGAYVCDLCPRTFSRYDHLLNHLTSHKFGTTKKCDP